ncbi:hypothetical protein D3C72_1742100 [compost metagenome]
MPALTAASSAIVRLSSARAIEITSSATERALAPGVLTTGIPAAVAAATSTIFVPAPWLPMIRRRAPAAMAAPSSPALRVMTASQSPMAFATSAMAAEAGVTHSMPARCSSSIPCLWIG